MSLHSPGPQAAKVGVIILGGAHGSLALARGLAAHGVDVVYVTSDHPLPASSRHVRLSARWPGIQNGREALNWLLAFARDSKLEGYLLIAGGDAEVQWVSQFLDDLSGTLRALTTPWGRLQKLCDKARLYQLAEDLGLDFPRTYAISSSDSLSPQNYRFPVIIKPSVRVATNRLTQDKAWRADDTDQLATLYTEAARLMGNGGVVVQEMIPGGLNTQFSYCAFWKDGEEAAFLTACRQRQYPIEFGYTSTFVETLIEPAVAEAARKLLKAARFNGLVEVEFIRDRRDGRFAVLDVNPRPWSWFGLSAAAHVDFAKLIAGDLKNQPAQTGPQRPARWMNLLRDIVSAGYWIKSGQLPVSQYLRSFQLPLVWSAFSWADPMPGLIDLPITLWRALSKRVWARVKWAVARKTPRAVAKPKQS